MTNPIMITEGAIYQVLADRPSLHWRRRRRVQGPRPGDQLEQPEVGYDLRFNPTYKQVTNLNNPNARKFDQCRDRCALNTNPWAAPGQAPSLGGGCGIFGGNPDGCDARLKIDPTYEQVPSPQGHATPRLRLWSRCASWSRAEGNLVVRDRREALRLPADDHHGVGDRVGAGGRLADERQPQGRIRIQVEMATTMRMDGKDNVGDEVEYEYDEDSPSGCAKCQRKAVLESPRSASPRTSSSLPPTSP